MDVKGKVLQLFNKKK